MRLAPAAALLVLVACTPIATPPSPGPRGTDRAFTVTRGNAPALLASGEGRLVSITLTNVGDVAWPADGRVTYAWTGTQATINGEVTPLPWSVDPGQSVDLVVPIVAPMATGAYTFAWRLSDSAGSFEARGATATASVEVRAPEARISWSELQPPDRVYADVVTSLTATVANAGTVAWPAKNAGAVLLSYHWRDLAGRVLIWDGDRTPLDAALDPRGSTSRSVRIVPPASPGRYVLELDAVREGLGWFGGGPRVTVDVAAASYAAALSLVSAPSRVTVGQPIDVRIALKNTGGGPLPDAGARRTRLSYHVANSASKFVLWDGPRTDIGPLPRPGQATEVTATVRAPEAPGRYKLRFDLVQDGVTWFERRGNLPLDVSIEVLALDYKAFFAPPQAVRTMATGLTYTIRPTIMNIGDATWPKGGFQPVRIGAHWLDANGAVVLWDAARAELEKDLGPGESMTVPLEITAPEKPGAFTLVVDAVQEGIAWFAEHGTLPAKVALTVVPPTFRASLVGTLPTDLHAGEIASATVTVRNDGPFPWPFEGEHPVRVAHHWRDANGGLVVWDGFRSELSADVQLGESVTLPVWFFAPGRPGTYILEIDVVQEDVTWFAQKGSTLLRATVEVAP